MSTIRVARRARYTTVAKGAVNDQSLSFRARGLLVWLLDKPDDWRVDSTTIARHGTEGREAVRTALRELEQARYLRRQRVQNPDGKWSTETVVYESPYEPDPTLDLGDAGTPAASPAPRNPASVTRTSVDRTSVSRASNRGTDTETQDLPPSTPSPGTSQTVASAIWESFDPRPSSPFVGLRKIVERLQAAGWSDAEIEQAGRESPTLALGFLERRLRENRERSRRRRPGRPVLDDRSVPAGELKL